jgi:serine/threonine protein kinase
MPKFEPAANEEFSLRIENQDERFRAMEHPNAPNMAHAMEGGKAKVFRVQNVQSPNNCYALKVMRPKYREPALESVCRSLDKLKTIPGLVVCERRCLTSAVAPEAVRQYSNLEYAILMPWIDGQSWFDVLQLGKGGKYLSERKQALQLAANFASVLSVLERAGIAHCDLSAGNVILDLDKLQVELIDVEDIFAPNFPQPSAISLGTPGYQHKTSKHGQWNIKADRFAGAILLGEMLGSYEPQVWNASSGDSYFEESELQSNGCQRFSILISAISAHHQDLADLFAQSWAAETLDDCPAMSQWERTLSRIITGYTFEPINMSATIGKKFSPFWASFTDLPTANQKAPAVQWVDSVDAAQGGGPSGPPVRWDNAAPQQTEQPNSIEWLGAAKAKSDETDNGQTH